MTKEIPEPGASAATVTTFKQGNRTYEQKYVDCGKHNCGSCNTATGRYPSHGPYWYLCVPKNGRWYRIYLGKNCADDVIDVETPDSPDAPMRTAKTVPQPTRGPAHVEQLEKTLPESTLSKSSAGALEGLGSLLKELNDPAPVDQDLPGSTSTD